MLDQFTNLGSVVKNSGGCKAEVFYRVQITPSAMTHLKRIWADSAVSRALRVCLVNALVFLVFLYASETCAVWKTERWRRMSRVL